MQSSGFNEDRPKALFGSLPVNTGEGQRLLRLCQDAEYSANQASITSPDGCILRTRVILARGIRRIAGDIKDCSL